MHTIIPALGRLRQEDHQFEDSLATWREKEWEGSAVIQKKKKGDNRLCDKSTVTKVNFK